MTYAVQLPSDADGQAFRAAARQCLAIGLSPRDVAFVDETEALLEPSPATRAPPEAIHVPRKFSDLFEDAICHSDRARFALLYDLLWRIAKGDRDLVTNPADPVVAAVDRFARAVRRDIHKMHAFLRFRPRGLGEGTVFTAWFEPQHYILQRAVPFFVERFATMDWIIGTPQGTASWRNGALHFGPPFNKPPDQVDDDVLDELWVSYYRSTFNPARVRVSAMVREMPKRYWRNLPETTHVRELIATAPARVEEMGLRTAMPPPLFAERLGARASPDLDVAQADSIDGLKQDISACRRCPLHVPATQAVYGEGPPDATLMFVGEQPGDQEDLAGRPFVGPAGQLLDKALAEAGLDRSKAFMTNAVKHFKFEPRGKRRIHQKPSTGEAQACRWWLAEEIARLDPKLIIALGGTAAGVLAQRPVAVTRERGFTSFGERTGFVTVHPSYLLRIPDRNRSEAEYRAFVEDLRRVAETVA